jgi:hypothetical protein
VSATNGADDLPIHATIGDGDSSGPGDQTNGAAAGDGSHDGEDGRDELPRTAGVTAADEAQMFPEPPGWAALQRLAGRARRRLRK